jgi:hypothetical protein
MLLGGLYARGIGRPAHGPHPADVRRRGGEAAVARALGWLTGEDDGVDAAAREAGPNAAFNLTVLTHLLGTPLEPDLAGHVLFLEDVDEHHYRIDRAMFQLTSTPSMRRWRVSRRTVRGAANDRPFGMERTRSCGTGARGAASPIWARRTSATTRRTASCRSAGSLRFDDGVHLSGAGQPGGRHGRGAGGGERACARGVRGSRRGAWRGPVGADAGRAGETLTLTRNAQPAIMANAIATLRVLEREHGVVLAERRRSSRAQPGRIYGVVRGGRAGPRDDGAAAAAARRGDAGGGAGRRRRDGGDGNGLG